MKEIRHISTTFNGRRIALAEFQSQVQIFDISTLSVISEFQTILDFGGTRMAISENGRICICGCWERHGIIAYNADTGEKIWQRKDLKKLQHLYILPLDTNSLFAQFDTGASRILNIETGMDIKKLNGIKLYWESPYDSVNVHEKASRIELVDRRNQKVVAKIQKETFATLALAFSPGSFIISESGGPLSCYHITDGRLLWQIALGLDGHFLTLSFHPLLKRFLGVTWPFMKGGNKKLKLINPLTGVIEKEMDINCPTETEFALTGQVLITSDRTLIDTESQEIKTWG